MSLLQIFWILFWWRVHGFSHIFLYLWYHFFGKLMPFLWKFGGSLAAVWRQFGGSLVAVWWQFQSLHLQVKGETKTATKLPPNFHQTSTKLPPNCHQTSTKLPPKCHQTSTKLPPNCHQTSTKLPPKCHQISTKMSPNFKKNTTTSKKHQGSTKYVPKIELCSMRFQDSKNHCLPFFCGIKGFVNIKVMHSFLCLQCSWLYSMRTLWQFDVVILFINIGNECILPFFIDCVSTNIASCVQHTSTHTHTLTHTYSKHNKQLVHQSFALLELTHTSVVAMSMTATRSTFRRPSASFDKEGTEEESKTEDKEE